MLGLCRPDAPWILHLSAFLQRFRLFLLRCRGTVWRRVMCFQYAIHGITVFTSGLLAACNFGRLRGGLEHYSMFRLIFSYSASESPGSLYTENPRVSRSGYQATDSGLTIEVLIRTSIGGAYVIISLIGKR